MSSHGIILHVIALLFSVANSGVKTVLTRFG